MLYSLSIGLLFVSLHWNVRPPGASLGHAVTGQKLVIHKYFWNKSSHLSSPNFCKNFLENTPHSMDTQLRRTQIRKNRGFSSAGSAFPPHNGGGKWASPVGPKISSKSEIPGLQADQASGALLSSPEVSFWILEELTRDKAACSGNVPTFPSFVLVGTLGPHGFIKNGSYSWSILDRTPTGRVDERRMRQGWLGPSGTEEHPGPQALRQGWRFQEADQMSEAGHNQNSKKPV